MAYIQDVQESVPALPEAGNLTSFVVLSQNENGRRLNFKIVGVDIPSGSTATFSGTKPDGVVYSTTGTISGNIVTVNEDIQMTAVAGSWDAKIRVLNGGNVIASAKVRITIDADPVAPGSIPSDSQLDGIVAECQAYAESARSDAYGSPLTASTAAGMIDKTRVYVYTGSETGYTNGHWYYWDGSAWADGGTYNSSGIQTDTTLSVPGMAADAKAVGDELTDLKEDFNENTHTFESTNLNDEVYELGRFYANGSDLDGSTDAFRSKNYLPVTGGKTIKYCGEYVLSGMSIANIYVVEYKADKSINVERQILYSYNNTSYTTEITLANDTSFIRICVYPFIETYDNTRIKVAYSDVFTPVYEPAAVTKVLAYEKIADSNGKYIDEIIRDTIDESEESLRIDDINGVEIGKNKFNKNDVVEGYLNVDGTIWTNTSYYTSGNIRLEKGESYYCRYGERIVSYDYTGNALKLVDGGGLFTMPSDKDYIRVSVLKSLVDVCQIEQGESYGGYAPFVRKIESLACNPNPIVITSPLANSVIKISNDKSIIVCGVDTESEGIVFANDMTNNALRKVQAQWVSSFDLGYPSGCSFFYKMLKFKGDIYGVGMDESDSNMWKIWRGAYNSDTTAITWENAPVWVARDNIVKVSLACDFNCNSDYLFLGEYGFRDGNGAKVYRSADGTTWEEIKTLANSIHCHAICPDPYVDGSVWMCSGEAQGYIYHSADNGSTWEIISEVYGFQSCQISFTEDNVYFADDSTQQTATVVNKYVKIPFLLTNDVVNKFGVYGANEGDTYYTNAFYGAVNSDGVYIGVIQDQTSGGNVAGVFRVLELGGHASILKKVEILPTPTGYSLLSEVYQTGTEIYFNQYFMHRPTVKRLNLLT